MRPQLVFLVGLVACAGCSLIYPDDGLTGGEHASFDTGTSPRDALGNGKDAGPLAEYCAAASPCAPLTHHCCEYTNDTMQCLPVGTPCPDTSPALSVDVTCRTTRDCADSGLDRPVCCRKDDWETGNSIESTVCKSTTCGGSGEIWRLCDPGSATSGAHDEECNAGEVCTPDQLTARDGTYQQHWGRCEPTTP